MQKGDKLKIVEEIVHSKATKKKTTIGIIEQITKFNIVIRKIHNGELTHDTSFNIADFIDTKKHFYINKNNSWVPIRIKITEFNECNDIGRGKGGKYA
ncbi:hypothetical protein [Clostridium beijerinckii]|uniref:hypothetical protein n=1 Tax=Clostridium beijerinckii TaxID=1520 RepID=UPI001361E1E4|nr:hypothetical protein [Clostridium beijerinckii]MZK53342.1 hypothetical protein [Clostridium beijerinckii]MZK61447.1 hypothetical protein [Clostridium beijerinckii]MZK71689.1 hypothetical protein [Clostridium beijerinckii]MZK77082.1 hypothetical protein [Clostridium beijerinckii]MZK86737.1 hypothetical protein [Clostridium beijerinckii]